MSSLKILLFPLSILISIILLWFFVKPLYDEASSLNKIRRASLNSMVQRENDLQQRASKISEAMDQGGQSQVIVNALPKEKETKNLISQLEYVINKENMSLTSVTIQDSSVEQSGINATIAAGQSDKPYRELTGSIDIKGNYGQFKKLLADLRRLDRIIVINELSLSSTNSDDGTLGKYIINFSVYWQDEITPEEARTGLESMEMLQK